MSGPISGLRVVEIAQGIAGPYCGRLLADLGASVMKLEPPKGDVLRHWGPFPNNDADGRGGLFEYLNAGKKGASLGEAGSGSQNAFDLIKYADVLVSDALNGWIEPWNLDPVRLIGGQGLVHVELSDFGRTGPNCDRLSTPLTMQAASGWISIRDPAHGPVQAGGRIPEYVGGAYAGLAALSALRVRDHVPGELVHVDLSMLECLISTLPYPMVTFERMKKRGLTGASGGGPMLGIVQAGDGWVGVNCLTGQHWLDLCAILGLPEYADRQMEIMKGGPARGEFYAKAQPWLSAQTVDEVIDICQSIRLPAAPVADGESILRVPQFAERHFFSELGYRSTASAKQPGPVFRLSRTGASRTGDAPSLGDAGVWDPDDRPLRPVADSNSSPLLPFAGLRVLDLTTFWAGAYVTCYLGAFGADIIKVESIQRPDGFRFSGAFPDEGEDWYERSPLWQSANLNKRDLTLDLTSDAGRDIAHQLASRSDVVIENFSPRVIEQFGLDYADLVEDRPDVIMIRMPGFGLEGPWRNYVGWALNIEQTAGMASITGFSDGPPCSLGGPADPIVGIHAGVALLAALEHRRRTGEGQLIELAQIEVAAGITAEPVIDYSMNGVVKPRQGNRQLGYVQGVYQANSPDDFVALSVRNDEDWAALAAVIKQSELLDNPRYSSAQGREAAHNEIDELIGNWLKTQSAASAVDLLTASGIPAEVVLTTPKMYEQIQLNARDYYQQLDHPKTGSQLIPGWPFRIEPGPTEHHRIPTPTLGQHNEEILAELGLTASEVETFKEKGIIGTHILGG